jgi:hypothetical protein
MDPSGTAASFECQVRSFTVSHAYEETAEAVRYLGDGCESPAVQERTDSISFDIDHALDATGLYQWALTNDLQAVEFEYVPNTGIGSATPASWTGTVIVTVPGVEASERGSRLTGTVEWTGAGMFTFTPAA